MQEYIFPTDLTSYDHLKSIIECEMFVIPVPAISVKDSYEYYECIETSSIQFRFHTGLNIVTNPRDMLLITVGITVGIEESLDNTIKRCQLHPLVKSRKAAFTCQLPIYMLMDIREDDSLLIEDINRQHGILLKAKQQGHAYKNYDTFNSVLSKIIYHG